MVEAWNEPERWLSVQDVERLREVVGDREDVLLLLTASDGTLLWGSVKGSVTLFGRTPEDYLGRLGQDYIHPEDRDEVAKVLLLAGRTGSTQELAYRAVAADGSVVRVRTVAWRVTATSGDAVVVSITVPRTRPRGVAV